MTECAACGKPTYGGKSHCPTCAGNLRRYGDPAIAGPSGNLGSCAVCRHPRRDQIEWYMRRPPKRVPLRLFGITKAQAHHHRHQHLDNPEHAARLAAHNIARLRAVRAEVAHAQEARP